MNLNCQMVRAKAVKQNRNRSFRQRQASLAKYLAKQKRKWWRLVNCRPCFVATEGVADFWPQKHEVSWIMVSWKFTQGKDTGQVSRQAEAQVMLGELPPLFCGHGRCHGFWATEEWGVMDHGVVEVCTKKRHRKHTLGVKSLSQVLQQAESQVITIGELPPANWQRENCRWNPAEKLQKTRNSTIS